MFLHYPHWREKRCKQKKLESKGAKKSKGGRHARDGNGLEGRAHITHFEP